MIKNMGNVDRRIRGFVMAPALVLAAWALGFTTIGGVVATVLAIVMAVTAAAGSCPLYLPFHIETGRQSLSHR